MHIAESKEEIQLLQRKKSGLEISIVLLDGTLAGRLRAIHQSNISRESVFSLPTSWLCMLFRLREKTSILIRKSRVSIAHCPRSNKETGVGKMPLKKFLDAGVTVGLGTDSLASSPTLNMWDEMRYAYQIHRRSGVSAEDIFRLATINGAKALGLDKEIGTLAPGKKADMIAVPLPGKDTGDIYSDLLRETKSCIMSMVNGKVLHKEGI